MDGWTDGQCLFLKSQPVLLGYTLIAFQQKLQAQALNASGSWRKVETEQKDGKEKSLKLQSESVQTQSLVFSLLFKGGEDLQVKQGQ